MEKKSQRSEPGVAKTAGTQKGFEMQATDSRDLLRRWPVPKLCVCRVKLWEAQGEETNSHKEVDD